MIKIERKSDHKSYFRDKDMYDTERTTEFRITLFGFTIYKTTEDFKCDIDDKSEIKPMGFKK